MHNIVIPSGVKHVSISTLHFKSFHKPRIVPVRLDIDSQIRHTLYYYGRWHPILIDPTDVARSHSTFNVCLLIALDPVTIIYTLRNRLSKQHVLSHG